MPFTNDGNLNVDSGSSLDLTSPVVGGAPTIDLNGNLGLDGNLYLYSTATSSSGFTLGSGSGYFEVGGVPGSGNPSGTLMVPSGVSDHIQGNLEINGNSTLTGGGTVYNSGLLQLDTGSSTAGLGAYVQSNSGTLAEVVGAMGMFTPLRVTGMAQLSGTLTLPGYVPKVGSKFTVVIAGQLEDHFDSIPDGMVETDGPNTSTVTQVNPPA